MGCSIPWDRSRVSPKMKMRGTVLLTLDGWRGLRTPIIRTAPPMMPLNRIEPGLAMHNYRAQQRWYGRRHRKCYGVDVRRRAPVGMHKRRSFAFGGIVSADFASPLRVDFSHATRVPENLWGMLFGIGEHALRGAEALVESASSLCQGV